MADLSRVEKYTIAFLRMAAIEVRRIADDAPEVAERLRVVASKLDAEADDLTRALSEAGSTVGSSLSSG